MNVSLSRRKLLIVGSTGAFAAGAGLVAPPAFSQKAAYYMPKAVSDWGNAPVATLGAQKPKMQFAQHAEVSHLQTANDPRTPYTLLGRVFDGNKNLVEFAHLNVWQTDADGTYSDSAYRGAVSADREGRFSVSTVMPTAYYDTAGNLRAPHLHIAVLAPRVSRQVFETEMFFPGDQVARMVDPDFVAENEIEFELQTDGTLLGYFNIFLTA